MLAMDYDIRIGRYKVGMLESVTVRKSVESLADTATIVMPATYINRSNGIEAKLKEGDEVMIRLGYNGSLETEFKGYLNAVRTDDCSITIECEDAIYLFRKELADKEYKSITVKSLLQQIVQQINPSYKVMCDYDFTYDKFVVCDATAWDVIKKVQDETKANIYFAGTQLHVHPQYSEITNKQEVVYDFSINVEKSKLKYRKADERKYFVEVEGILGSGERITVTCGKPGGDKRSIKVYGVTDRSSLQKRAREELSTITYTGFEGNFTGWLVPYCEPAYKVRLRDREYPDKDGTYYVVSTETQFSQAGGERTVTIGKKIG